MLDACSLEIFSPHTEVWLHMHSVVTLDMATSLMCPYTNIELHAAVGALDAPLSLGMMDSLISSF